MALPGFTSKETENHHKAELMGNPPLIGASHPVGHIPSLISYLQKKLPPKSSG
jgi:hypothetical protein